MSSVLAAQMYTLRDFTKTPADIAKTFKRVKQIGYNAVQASALGPIEPKELRKILDDTGLVCCATHESFEAMRDKSQEILDKHHTIGCKYSAIGGLPQSYRSPEGYLRFATEYSEVARKLKAGGLEVGYHNHHWEFEKVNGKAALQVLIELCDPVVHFEIDTFWVQTGGGDPTVWIKKVKNRIPLVHLKDLVFGVDKTSAAGLKLADGETLDAFRKRQEAALAGKPIMAEVGEGNMNFVEILKACKEANVVWYIVEQDTCQRDPFESLAISLKNLKAMGMK